jgi:hypothetical protein
MTNPAERRHEHDQSPRKTDDGRPVTEEERRAIDPTQQVHGAHDNADEAIRTSDPTRTGGASLFEIQGDVESSDAVPKQPHNDGIGPFSTPVILIVVALVIFVALIVTFG